jgi:uncharacterized protein YodC (DUF2158 family)
MESNFKIGEVVNLKSDKSNKMTVNEVNDGIVKCIWFDITVEIKERDFKFEVLEHSSSI